MPGYLRKLPPLTDAKFAELLYGPENGTAFGSDEERRAYWEAWRAWFMVQGDLLAMRGYLRPWGWWRYDKGLPGRPEDEAAVLEAMGEAPEWD